MLKRLWRVLFPHAAISAEIRAQIQGLKRIPPAQWTKSDFELLSNLSNLRRLIHEHEVTAVHTAQKIAAILIPAIVLYTALTPSARTAVTIDGSSTYLEFRPLPDGAGLASDLPVQGLKITFNGRVDIGDVLNGVEIVPSRQASSVTISTPEPSCKVTLDGLEWPQNSIVQARVSHGRYGIRVRAATSFTVGAALTGDCDVLVDDTELKVRANSARITVSSDDAVTDLQFSQPHEATPFSFSRARATEVGFTASEGNRGVSGLIDAHVTYDGLPNGPGAIRERGVLTVVPAADVSLDRVTFSADEIGFQLSGEVARLRGGSDGTRQLMPRILDQVREALRTAVLLIYAGVLLWRRDPVSIKEFS